MTTPFEAGTDASESDALAPATGAPAEQVYEDETARYWMPPPPSPEAPVAPEVIPDVPTATEDAPAGGTVATALGPRRRHTADILPADSSVGFRLGAKHIVAFLGVVAIIGGSVMGGRVLGSDSPSGPAVKRPSKVAKPLSKAAFIKKGDALCKTLNDKVDALPDPTTPQEIPSYMNDAEVIVVRGLAKLKALVPPKGDRALLRKWFATTDAMVTRLGSFEDAALAGDPAAFQATMSELDRLDKKADRIAKRHGFDDCAE